MTDPSPTKSGLSILNLNAPIAMVGTLMAFAVGGTVYLNSEFEASRTQTSLLVAESEKQTQALLVNFKEQLDLTKDEIEERLAHQEKVTEALIIRITSIETNAEIAYNDRHTLSNMSEYALRLLIANPDMTIPDPRDPNRNMSINFGRLEETTE